MKFTPPDHVPPTPPGVPVPYPNVGRWRRPANDILFFDEADSIFAKRTG